MIVESNIEISIGGSLTHTIVDHKGNSFTANNIIMDEDLIIQKVLKKREYTNGMQCTIDFETYTPETFESIGGCGIRPNETIKTIKPFSGSVSKLTDVSDGIHPVLNKGRKEMNDDVTNAMIMGLTMSNPCREIKFPEILWRERKVKEENTNWKFKSSADADINWKDIKDSLDYAEPLALVTRKYRDYIGEDVYVVVAKELMDKAKMVGIKTPKIEATVEKRVFCVKTNFSDWVDWAKAVKTAKWPDGIKSTISVVLPTV